MKTCCICGGSAFQEGMGGLPFCGGCYDKYMFVPNTLVKHGGYKDYFLEDRSIVGMVKDLFKI